MKDKILKLIEKGLTYKEIKKELGCAISTISYHCKMNKVENKNINKKTDIDTINEINRLYEILKSSDKVAKELKISKKTILKYVKVINYKEKLTNGELKLNASKSVVDWRKRKKIELVEYKGGSCIKCGYNKCISALEFHHIDPNGKDFSIGGKSWSFERLKKEVDKCILVCSNCHREIHEEI
jgi:DNA-binding CsgD family transcriptional regulator